MPHPACHAHMPRPCATPGMPRHPRVPFFILLPAISPPCALHCPGDSTDSAAIRGPLLSVVCHATWKFQYRVCGCHPLARSSATVVVIAWPALTIAILHARDRSRLRACDLVAMAFCCASRLSGRERLKIACRGPIHSTPTWQVSRYCRVRSAGERSHHSEPAPAISRFAFPPVPPAAPDKQDCLPEPHPEPRAP